MLSSVFEINLSIYKLTCNFRLYGVLIIFEYFDIKSSKNEKKNLCRTITQQNTYYVELED